MNELIYLSAEGALPSVPKGLVQQRHAIPILKVSDHQRKLVSEIGLVGEYTSGCCLELPPMLWLVIALLGLSVHGRLFASRSKIVE
jgi:hypothetical protein